MLVEEYIQIAKETFPYLFNQYGFKVVYRYQGEGRDLGRYAFGLESDVYRMRILFSRENGAGTISFGPVNAPFTYEYAYQYWTNDGNLLWYLNHHRTDWSSVDKYKGENRIQPLFELVSSLLKPHCPAVLEVFSSAEAFASWKEKYNEFLKTHIMKSG